MALDGPVLLVSPGYSTHVRRFLEALTGAGLEALFLAVGGGPSNLEGRPLPPGSRSIPWAGPDGSEVVDRLSEYTSALQAVVDSERPSLVLAGPIDSIGLAAAGLTGTSVVQMSHGSDLLASPPGSLTQRGIPAALMAAQGVFVDSRAGEAVAISLGVDRQRIWTMPWGIDLTEFSYSPWPDDAEELRAISIRSLEEVYDPLTVIRGFAEASRSSEHPIRLTIAGDGTMAPVVSQEIGRLGLEERVQLLGRIPESRLPELLAAHHLHISASRSDGTSISQLQALATGRPAVASDIPANREWIRGGETGFLFPVGGVSELSSVLVGCAGDLHGLAQLGGLARARVEVFADWRRNTAVWVSWLEQLAKS